MKALRDFSMPIDITNSYPLKVFIRHCYISVGCLLKIVLPYLFFSFF